MSNDNKTTAPTDFTEAMYQWVLDNNPEFRAGEEAKQQLLSENKALQDQSLIMALAANGPQPLASYGMGPIHAASRVVRGIQNRSLGSLTGIPGTTALKKAIKHKGRDRDKVLWKTTGNAAKINQLTQE